MKMRLRMRMMMRRRRKRRRMRRWRRRRRRRRSRRRRFMRLRRRIHTEVVFQICIHPLHNYLMEVIAHCLIPPLLVTMRRGGA